MTNDKAKSSRPSSGDEILVNAFTEESAQEFREQLLKKAKCDPSTPIVVYIDSYGGYVDSLSKMIETMDEVPNPIITVAQGKAMSCGAILLSHGDIRFVGKHARVMIHEISGGTSGDVHDMHSDAIESKRLNKHFMGLLAKNCKIKNGYEGLRKIIKERDGRDVYLSADESVKFGVADIIGMPQLSAMTMYSVGLTPPKVNTTKATKPAKTKKKK